jgi:hypothetical protein
MKMYHWTTITTSEDVQPPPSMNRRRDIQVLFAGYLSEIQILRLKDWRQLPYLQSRQAKMGPAPREGEELVGHLSCRAYGYHDCPK